MPIEIKTISEDKSKNGIVRQKKVRITNTDPKQGINFESVQNIYSELLKKYKADRIGIVGMFMDGGQKSINEPSHTTLKKYDNTNQTLNLFDEEYYSSIPIEKRDKFKRFYSLDVYIKNPYKHTKI